MWKLAPELANQRAFVKEGTKTWDKFFLATYFPISLLVFPIVAGLDAGRFHWSQLGITYAIAGVVLYLACFILGYWAMVANEHFEATVRIQEDRDHKVITRGPYRFIRHPGYFGGLLFNIATPLVFGSFWGLIPTIVAIILLFVRTYLEDKTLQAELPGYVDYTKEVKFKLLPGIW